MNMSSYFFSFMVYEIIVFLCCFLVNIVYGEKEFIKVNSLKINVSFIFLYVCNDSLILKLFYFLF